MALKPCPNCGAMVSDQAIVCPKCGHALSSNAVINTDDNTVSNEDASIALKIISFFIPIVGWVLWGIWRKEYPVKAKTCAKMAWIGFVITLILNLLTY